jgi:hypothetical protein
MVNPQCVRQARAQRDADIGARRCKGSAKTVTVSTIPDQLQRPLVSDRDEVGRRPKRGGVSQAADRFRRLIDRAIEHGGQLFSYPPPLGEARAG